MSELEGIPQDRLKLRFSMPEGKISRRDLLKMVVPHYQVIPFIESASCRGSQECTLCVDSCPLGAIKIADDEVTIETALCGGCGACVTDCPWKAIVYPAFSPEQLDKEMERLLTPQDSGATPRVMALICQSCLPASDEDGVEQLICPPGVVALKIPCLAMASPWLLLRAFDRGAHGLALVSHRRKCAAGVDPEIWQENVRFIRGLLGGWDVEPERLRILEVAGEDSAGIVRELEEFAQEIAGLGDTSLTVAEPVSIPGDGLLLPALVKGLKNKLGGSSKGVVTAGTVPFAKLELDSAQCIACGLCARECPLEALTASSGEEGGCQLLFRHDLCVACGRCVDVCPERCLKLERILDMGIIDAPAVVLFEDVFSRCRECGGIIGSNAILEKVRVKLSAMGESFTSQLELCPACKTRQFSMGKANLGDTTRPE